MRRAKIVCTIGPAVDDPVKIRALVDAGMDVARINRSHGSFEDAERHIAMVREAAEAAGRQVGVLVDLQGPKIRTGRFATGPVLLNDGDRFTITIDDVDGDKDRVSTTFKGLPGDVRPGDTLLVDDGKICLRAVEVTPTDVVTEVTEGGTISNNKGINLPGVPVSVPALSDKDEEDLRWALRMGADWIALSFVRDARDVIRCHEIMEDEDVRRPILAKVEKPQAVANLAEIIRAFDGIMVARGDLGVEMPLEEVPLVQKQAIELARREAKPVIVATQVLESMIDNSRPTRAEASDCANAVLDGTDALMLSGRDERRRLADPGGPHDGPHYREHGGPRSGPDPPAGHRTLHRRRRRHRGGRADRARAAGEVPGVLQLLRRLRPADVPGAVRAADARLHQRPADRAAADADLGGRGRSSSPSSGTCRRWSRPSTKPSSPRASSPTGTSSSWWQADRTA
jgi:hypothetical protein